MGIDLILRVFYLPAHGPHLGGQFPVKNYHKGENRKENEGIHYIDMQHEQCDGDQINSLHPNLHRFIDDEWPAIFDVGMESLQIVSCSILGKLFVGDLVDLLCEFFFLQQNFPVFVTLLHIVGRG